MNTFCTSPQFFYNIGGRGINGLFVFYFMLNTCPEIHGNGTELYLHLHPFLFVCKKYRNLQNQMKASIAVWLGILDIILFFDQADIIL